MAGIGDNLAGIMGVMQRNKALREDRRQFDLNLGLDQRKIADAERRTGAYVTAAEAQAAESQARVGQVERENSQEDAGEFHYTIQEQGILHPNNRVDTDAVWTGLESGNAAATQGAIDLLNYGDESLKLTPEGFKIDGITPTKDGYIIEGVYADGKRGVLTQEGGSGNDEKVMVLDKKAINHLLQQSNSQIMQDAGMADRNLSLNANLAVAKAASDQYRANQTHLDVNENAVVSTIAGQEQAAGSDRQASRAMISALSSAETEAERQGILLEFASEYDVELPYMEEAQAAVENETVPAEEPKTYGKGRMARSKQVADQRNASRREALPDLLAEAEADLAQVRADFAERGIEPRRSGASGELEHPTIQSRVDEITKLKAEMEEAGIAPAPEPSVDYKALEQRVTSFIAEMPEGDLATAVENGDLQFTEQDTAVVSQRMQEQNVTTAAGIADMQRVEDQAMAYAMLATYAPDPNTRDWATKQIRNLGETGTGSMSTKDALTAATNQQNANSNSLNARTNRKNADADSTLSADGVLDEVNAIRAAKAEGDWDFSNPADSQRLFSLINLGDATGQQYTREFFNSQINEAVANISNNPNSWWGGFLSLFDNNAVPDPTSFKFENVRLRTDSKGNVEEFFYINNDGSPAGQPIPASDMRQALGGSQAAFDAVSASAKRNSGIQ